MALINIEYGSLASSDTMNKNFTYLDDKIAETSENIMTSISSILSNIATINTRLNEINENLGGSVDTLNVKLEDFKTEATKMVSDNIMVPNWSNCTRISVPTSGYTTPNNGYILLIPQTTAAGNIKVNGVSVAFKKIDSIDDYSAQLVPFPVKKGDVVTVAVSCVAIYFLPTLELNV